MFFNFDTDIYVCGIYIAPQGSSFSDRNDELYPILEQEMIHFSTKRNCIACGDFNGYTGTESDFIETDDNRCLPLPLYYSVDTLLETIVILEYQMDLAINCWIYVRILT